MAYKTLGQVAPGATTATTLYTVPGSVSTVVSTIAVCNRGATGSYRIAVRPAGATLSNEHYLAYDCGLAATSTDYHTIGVTLATTDVITVYGSHANFSFSAFGNEA